MVLEKRSCHQLQQKISEIVNERRFEIRHLGGATENVVWRMNTIMSSDRTVPAGEKVASGSRKTTHQSPLVRTALAGKAFVCAFIELT